jgi:hypothetical protein
MIQPVVRRIASRISRIPVHEVVAAVDGIGDHGNRQQHGDPVPPHHAVAEPLADWKQQERQEQHHRDVDRPKDLRRDDGIGAVQVEHRHAHRRQRDEDGEPAAEAICRALFFLDVQLRLAQRFFADHRFRCGHRWRLLRHRAALN